MRGALFRIASSHGTRATALTSATTAFLIGSTWHERQRSAWASSEDASGASAEPPKKPGIYQSAGFDPSAIEAVAQLLQAHTRGQMAQKKAESSEAQRKEHEKQGQYKAATRELSSQARHERRQQDAETRDERRRQDEVRSQYRSQLAAEREAAARRLEEVLKQGEDGERIEHEKRLEGIRRETAEIEANLRRETDAKYLQAKATFTARAERQMHDLRLTMLRERGLAARDAALEAISTSLESLGAGFYALIGDKRRIAALVTVVAAGTLGVTAARQATRIAGNFVAARLKKPTLIRETSRGYALASSSVLPPVVGRAASRISFALTAPVAGDDLAGVVLEGAAFKPELETTLVGFAKSLANTRKHNAPFRHALLHGPPGTGKTMFARRLAQSAGMDYAILSGGDVLPLGREAVTEVHRLFDWARTSPRGLLLLVDEADAFCRSRSTHMSEDARNALNAFLHRTGTPTRHVLVVFATNAPELFDPGILDRVDTVICFDLPGETERKRILSYGIKEFATPLNHDGDVPGTSDEASDSIFQRVYYGLTGYSPVRRVRLDGVTSADIDAAAAKTAGFSAREVAKLSIAWRAAAVGASPTDPTLTPKLMGQVTEVQIETTRQKRVWYSMALGDKEHAVDAHGEVASA